MRATPTDHSAGLTGGTVTIKNGTIKYDTGYSGYIVGAIENTGGVKFENVELDESVSDEILLVWASSGSGVVDTATVNVDANCTRFEGKKIRCVTYINNNDSLIYNGQGNPFGIPETSSVYGNPVESNTYLVTIPNPASGHLR